LRLEIKAENLSIAEQAKAGGQERVLESTPRNAENGPRRRAS